MKPLLLKWLLVCGGLLLVALVAIGTQLPAIGASLMVHPYRQAAPPSPPDGCENVTLKGNGIDLAAWRGLAEGPRRGTLIYLHGISDNRRSSAGVLPRYRKRGFDVIAFDSRAHGASGGTCCTYGVLEKEDLKRVIDTLEPGPVILVGSSLGAAIALQEAAIDPRVTGVVSAESFSDLHTVATERAPFFFTSGIIASSFREAEKRASFAIDSASPVLAAASVRVPVFVIHGEQDQATAPYHAHRIHKALAGPKRLLIVPGAGHNHALRSEVWAEIDSWIDSLVPPSKKAAAGP